jgi:hypothetical protein
MIMGQSGAERVVHADEAELVVRDSVSESHQWHRSVASSGNDFKQQLVSLMLYCRYRHVQEV